MEVRYSVTLNDRVVGTVSLQEQAAGALVARLNPLPAFRALREMRRRLSAVDRTPMGRELTEDELAGEEDALAALRQLEMRLVDERSGVLVPNASVQLLRGEPPRVRIMFWRPEDARDHPDRAG